VRESSSPKNDASTMEESDAGVEPAGRGARPKKVTAFELHGRAGFDKVSIFSAPDMESPRLGYLRKGRRTMVGDAEYATQECPKGWFVLPEGGYVCQGRGMLVGAKPRYIRKVPPEPLVDMLDPYRHGFIRRDWTPAYKRIPAEEEMWAPPSKEAEDAEVPDGGEPILETLPHDEEEADGGVDYYKYAKRKHRIVRLLLSRGFWVSVAARRFDELTRKFYYETVKGDFVPAENVHLIKPPEFRGYRISGERPLPGAIIHARHAAFYDRRRKRFRSVGPAERLGTYRVHEVTEHRGASYYRIDNNRWLKSTQVVLFDLSPPPEGIGEEEKWIRVNLSRQTLEAYEGSMPVYATLVSTGLPESEETITPRGEFRILFKHLTDDMTGAVGDDDTYSVEDVPWVQYVHRNIALHASFWHSAYGRTKSHGCINLSPADARWLFDWTEPALPDGWHGVATTDGRPGTRVFVVGETPK